MTNENEYVSRGVQAEKERYARLTQEREQALEAYDQLQEQWNAPNGGAPHVDRDDLDRVQRDIKQLTEDIEDQQRRVRAAQQRERERGLEL